MKTNDIKKGMKIKTNQLGMLTSGKMSDSKRGNIRMIYTHGEEVGMVNEMGSVYAWNIIEVFNEDKDKWEQVEHTDKQLKDKQRIANFFI